MRKRDQSRVKLAGPWGKPSSVVWAPSSSSRTDMDSEWAE